MFNLVFNEWKKLSTQKSFRLLMLLFFLILFSSIFYFNATQTNEFNAYKKEIIQKADKHAKQGSIKGFIFNEYEKFKEKINQEEYKNLENLARIDGEVWQDILKEANFIEKAEKNFPLIAKRLLQRLNHPLYKDDSFARRSINKQQEVFNNVKDIKLNIIWGDWTGFDFFKSISWLDYIFLGISFSIIFILMEIEESQGIADLLLSTKTGLKRIVCAKLILLCFLSLFMMSIFYLSILLYGVYKGAFGPLERSIQSVERFHHSINSYNMKQLLLVFFAWKVLMSIFISLITAMIVGIAREKQISYLVFWGFIFLSLIVYNFIPLNSVWNFIPLLSLPGLLDPISIFGRYRTLSFFGVPISREYASIVIVVVTLFMMAYLSSRFLNKHILLEKKVTKGSFLNRLKGSNLFSHEYWRLLINQRGLIYIAIFCCISFMLVDKKKEEIFNFERQYYLYSLRSVEGRYTRETLYKLEQMEKNFIENKKNLEKIQIAFDKGKLSNFDYYKKLNKYEEIEAKRPQFEVVKAQIQKSIRESQGKNPIFVIDKKAEEFFLRQEKSNRIFSISTSILLFVSIANIFTKDQRYKLDSLIKSTKLGNKKLLGIRLSYVFCLSLVLTILAIIPYFETSIAKGYTLPLEASVVSLPGVFNFGVDISIVKLLIGLNILNFLSLILESSLILIIVQVFKSSWFKMFLYTITILLPITLSSFFNYRIGFVIPWAEAFRWGNMIDQNGFNRVLIAITIQIVLILISIWVNYRIWEKPMQ